MRHFCQRIAAQRRDQQRVRPAAQFYMIRPGISASARSVKTGFFDRVDRDNGVTKSFEAGVWITRTDAPSFISSLTNSNDLYAAMLPVTPKRTFFPWNIDICYNLIPKCETAGCLSAALPYN